MFVKNIVAAMTVATMITSSAFAGEASLAPGKPSGVEKAQILDSIGTGTLLVGAGIAGIIAAVAITVSNQSANNPPTGVVGTGNTTSVTPATAV